MHDALNWAVSNVANKDFQMEVTQVPERFFDFTEQENWSLQLVIMQLSKHDYQLNEVFRHELAKRLQDFDQQLSPAIRVFISDLLQVAPISKPNKKKYPCA